MVKYDAGIDGCEKHERGKAKFQVFLEESSRYIHVHKLIECGLSNLNALNKTNWSKLRRVADAMLMASHTPPKLISALEQHGKYCTKTLIAVPCIFKLFLIPPMNAHKCLLQ